MSYAHLPRRIPASVTLTDQIHLDCQCAEMRHNSTGSSLPTRYVISTEEQVNYCCPMFATVQPSLLLGTAVFPLRRRQDTVPASCPSPTTRSWEGKELAEFQGNQKSCVAAAGVYKQCHGRATLGLQGLISPSVFVFGGVHSSQKLQALYVIPHVVPGARVIFRI